MPFDVKIAILSVAIFYVVIMRKRRNKRIREDVEAMIYLVITAIILLVLKYFEIMEW